MNPLLKEIRHNPLLWLLALAPVVFAVPKFKPESHTLLFVLSVLAIVPLAALLSHATELVAAKTGDSVGGLLNATLGNLTELAIVLAVRRAGQYMLVKASVAGSIVTNTLFVLGASFLLGGLKHHVQEYNRVSARVQAGLLFLATFALLIPSAIGEADSAAVAFGTTPAFVGFIVVALVGGAAEMGSAFSGARKDRLDLSVGIALGSAAQIALFVAPVLVLLSYVMGPTPMNLQFWPGAVVMMLIATLTASLVKNSGRSAWFVGTLVLMVYAIFAMTLYLLPPRML
jgi:Ca2+/H+ antiporter